MKKQSFTLVELLVVVGIIALLAGLIIPAVGMAQTSARRTACLSNQGQVMKIIRAYMNEGDQQFLPGNTDYTWIKALYQGNKVANDIAFARCPAIIPLTDATVNSAADSSLEEAYGMIYSQRSAVAGIDFKSNRALRCTPNTGDPFVVAANQLALGGCSASLDTNRDQVVAKARISFGQQGNSNDIGRPALVHGDQTNVFFLDGHAEGFTRGTLFIKRYYTVVNGDGPSPVSPRTAAREAIQVAQQKTSSTANATTLSETPAADKDWMIEPDSAK